MEGEGPQSQTQGPVGWGLGDAQGRAAPGDGGRGVGPSCRVADLEAAGQAGGAQGSIPQRMPGPQ